jgi:hypothetical protein
MDETFFVGGQESGGKTRAPGEKLAFVQSAGRR